MRPIVSVAADLGLAESDLVPYGRDVAKVELAAVAAASSRRRGKVLLVTAMTPSEHGEGKTVTAIGLAMALERAGHRAVPCLRQPSLGPVFGVKGGATGGGLATVEPSNRINLGFTGDLRAVADAQNLLAAIVDNHLHHGNRAGLDPAGIEVPRTLDLDDRALRHVRVGAGPKIGPERADRFVIAAASETASIHQLATGPEDLEQRLDRLLVGHRPDGGIVTARALGASGAMAALLGDAIRPNLVQTREGTPALVHAGPFANLGTGTASVVSIRLALGRADFAVVEAGFAADLGAEKFVDLVGPVGGFLPDAAVLVATIVGLRHHGGVAAGPTHPDADAVNRGLANLDHHIGILRALGVRTVVALNRHPSDSDPEIAIVLDHLAEADVPLAVSTTFLEGSAGAAELAARVVEAVQKGSTPRPITGPGTGWRSRLETIAQRVYGAAEVRFTPEAEADAAGIEAAGLSTAPVLMAKTPLSITDDPRRLGAPTGFPVTVTRLRRWAGAGFVVAELGPILTMPGLPEHPHAERIRLSARGEVEGVE
ncbi:MAG TPA: formate--tetrahydrofolate ligase [Thermoplasmata archaeon]|nr:formate--tetrahydrofolate ligase [Thermoplasmata archaeon]